jgi:hypothetical protein
MSCVFGKVGMGNVQSTCIDKVLVWSPEVYAIFTWKISYVVDETGGLRWHQVPHSSKLLWISRAGVGTINISCRRLHGAQDSELWCRCQD